MTDDLNGWTEVEILEDLLRSVEGRVAASPPGGCYWCGWNPHEEPCIVAPTLAYLRRLVAEKRAAQGGGS